MGYPSGLVGLPIPFGNEGNNVPHDLLAFAQRLDAIFAPYTYAQITALSGSDLWDARIIYQSDVGALRPFTGLYAYSAAHSCWQAMIPTSAGTWTPLDLSVGSPPTLGTNSRNSGNYVRFGSFVFGQFNIVCGSPGYVNGTWNIRAPVSGIKDNGINLPDPGIAVGMMTILDGSPANSYIATLACGLANGALDPAGTLLSGEMEGTTTGFTSTSPITFASGDAVAGVLFYEATEQIV